MPFPHNFVSIFLLLHFFIFPFSISLPLPFPLPPPFLQAQEEPICPSQWSPPFAGANLCIKVVNKTATYPAAIRACESFDPSASLLDVAHFGNAEFNAMVDNHLVKPGQIYWVKNGGTKNCTELVIGDNATERTEVLPLGNGLCEIENPFICQMKPIETTTTSTTEMSTTTSTPQSTKTTEMTTSPPSESTSSSSSSMASQNSTVPPATNAGCGDEYEIQLYLEIQG